MSPQVIYALTDAGRAGHTTLIALHETAATPETARRAAQDRDAGR